MLGSIIVMIMLLFNSFLDQIVVYPNRLVPSEKASTVVRAQKYQAHSYEGVPLPSIVDISMKVCAGRELSDSTLTLILGSNIKWDI